MMAPYETSCVPSALCRRQSEHRNSDTPYLSSWRQALLDAILSQFFARILQRKNDELSCGFLIIILTNLHRNRSMEASLDCDELD